MTVWVYFASDAAADQTDTFDFALHDKVMFRPARNSGGSLIANVGNLRPGDWILLVYRESGRQVVRVQAHIAPVTRQVSGTRAIVKITGELSLAMTRKGYPALPGGGHEVIPVEQVYRCDVDLNGSYGGRNAIYKLAKIDAPSLKILRAISQ